MDSLLKNMTHINKTCGQLFSTLWDIQHIHSRLDFETTKILLQALVLTKLDYCNSLLAGTAKYQLDKMQRVQNMACCITCNLAKFDHIRTCMADLHWLCILQRINYKIACLVYKCQHGLAPQNLQELLSKQSIRTLRSSSTNHIPPLHCRTSPSHAFIICSCRTMDVEISNISYKSKGCLWFIQKSTKVIYLKFHIIKYYLNMFSAPVQA